MRQINGILIAFLLLSQVVQAQNNSENRPSRSPPDSEPDDFERQPNGRFPPPPSKGRRRQGLQRQQVQSETNEEQEQASQQKNQGKTSDSELNGQATSPQGTLNTEHREYENRENHRLRKEQKQERKNREHQIKHLIKLIIVIVVGGVIIAALLILKPIFLKRKNKEETNRGNANVNMNQVIALPVISVGRVEKAVVIQQQCMIEVIKQKFLNKEKERVHEQSSQQNCVSTTKIEGEQLKLTPTFGEYTFRNNK